MQDNSVERAADWIFSHIDEPVAMETDQAGAQPAAPKCRDGNGSNYHFDFSLIYCQITSLQL